REGALGRLYLAEDRALGRHVEVCVLLRELAARLKEDEWLRVELGSLARLTHKGVAKIHVVGPAAQYIVLEHARGETLGERMRRCRSFEPRSFYRIVQQIGGALAEAHGLGVAHGDIRPETVILTREARDENVVKVIDFGVKHLVARGKVDPRSDIHS